MYLTEYSSPLGSIFLASDGTALVGLWMEGQKYFAATLGADVTKNAELPVFRQIMDWLDAYFEKRPLPALPPLAPKGSDFRQAVWKLLLQIPYGEVTTYGELAHALQAQGVSGRGTGCWRSGRPQSNLHYHPLPPCCGGGWEPYRLCRRRG